MIVKYRKAYNGYWFYYSIGHLSYAMIYPSKRAFIEAKRFTDIKFLKIKEN